MGRDAKGTEKRRVRTGALILLGVVIALILLLAALFVRGPVLDARLKRRIAQLQAAGCPVNDRDVTVRRTVALGAVDVEAANALLACLEAPEAGSLQLATWLEVRHELGVKHAPALREAAEAQLAAAADWLAELRSAAGSVQGFPLPPRRGLWQRDLSHPGLLHEPVRILSASARLRAETGDAVGAADDLAAVLQLADSLGDEPLRIEHLVMADLDREAIGAIEGVLSVSEPVGEDLARLRALVERRPPSPEAGLLGERAWAFSTLGGASAEGLGGDDPRARTGVRVRFALPGGRAAAALSYDDVIEQCLRAGSSDLRERRRAFEELSRRFGAAWENEGWTRLPTAGLTRDCARYLEATVRHETRLLVAAMALAVEQWRVERGGWPESLEELVPEWLPEVPQDPYSEGQVAYRRRDDGVVVYSVGPDGADDGGLAREDAGPARLRDRGWDLPFRLLDPERRGAVTRSFREEVLAEPALISHLEELGFDEERLQELGLTPADVQQLRGR